MRMTRHARSRRVNKQYEAMAVVRCSACCLGASASTDGRHLLLRRLGRRPEPPVSQPSRPSPKQVAGLAIFPIEFAAAASRAVASSAVPAAVRGAGADA